METFRKSNGKSNFLFNLNHVNLIPSKEKSYYDIPYFYLVLFDKNILVNAHGTNSTLKYS